MIKLKLPDGSAREVPAGTRPRDVADSIGKRLAQAAVAAKVDGAIVDLDREIPAGNGEVAFQILTEKDKEALDVLRHSTAHIMARAVMRLFPGVKLAFGPTIENGFYYDIDVDPPIREEDFPRIEEEMRKIVKEAEPFERFEEPTAEARALVEKMGQSYKVEHIDEELKQFSSLSFYRQGEFIDLCRGPHIPHAGKVGAFKVLSIAGAYWKGDSSRKQLQRLYGTAFFNQKDLDAYLKRREEEKKRDHRVLGKQLKLFTINPELVGPGLILWMPRGATVRGLLEAFIKEELLKRGYQPVYTPHIGRLKMYEKSGHYPYYRESQFAPMAANPFTPDVKSHREVLGQLIELSKTYPPQLLHGLVQRDDEFTERVVPRIAEFPAEKYRQASAYQDKQDILTRWLESQEDYLLKPMNCPHHIQIYKAEPHSYRDLPVRLAEFGTVYRFEQTGELSGMTRVRGFTQDDAHLFVTPEQIRPEMEANLDLVLFVLRSLGLNDYRVRVGLRDPQGDKYVGNAENWARAERTLLDVVRDRGMNHTAEPGEAAFYGPKIDFVVRDCIGREWQLGTVQLDYNLPERFDLEYIGADNKAHRPVMIHRAPFGSMERFMGILIEHFAGAFPLWLAPEQARVIPVSERFEDYARRVEAELRAAGFRVSGDYQADTMKAKIRTASLEKIPYLLIVGEKEQSAGTVSLRDESIPVADEKNTKARDVGSLPVAEVISRFRREVDEKRIRAVSTASAGLSDSTAKFSG
jgi:threonyl-tRNA synthetase